MNRFNTGRAALDAELARLERRRQIIGNIAVIAFVIAITLFCISLGE